MRIASVRRGEERSFSSSIRLSSQAWRNEKPTPHRNLTRLMRVIWTYHRKPPTLGSATHYQVRGGGKATISLYATGTAASRTIPVRMRRYECVGTSLAQGTVRFNTKVDEILILDEI